MCNINERIKLLRKELGLNQNEFGSKIGVAQTYLSQIESGTRDLTDKILKIILLENWGGKNVNSEWLQTGEGEMFLQQSQDEKLAAFFADVNLTNEADFKKRFVSALAELDPEEWKMLEDIMRKCMDTQKED